MGRHMVNGTVDHTLSQYKKANRSRLGDLNRRYRQSHLSITTYYKHTYKTACSEACYKSFPCCVVSRCGAAGVETTLSFLLHMEIIKATAYFGIGCMAS